MPRRLVFRVSTPVGDHVVLSRDRWRQITRYKHPAVAGHEKLVRACLESPFVVRASARDADTHLYYTSARALVCVVTGLSRESQRFVVTAYFTRNIKEGTELWKKSRFTSIAREIR
jgi:hypothetical protein